MEFQKLFSVLLILLIFIFLIQFLSAMNVGILDNPDIGIDLIPSAATITNATINYYNVTYAGDGNASSICNGGEVLLGNGTCMDVSNFDGSTSMNYLNIAMTNQSNSFTGNQIINGNISANTSEFELTKLGKLIMSGDITSKNIIPITHNLYSLGNSSNWYSDVYADFIHATNLTASFLNSTNIDSINISSENIQSNEINTTLSQTKNLTTEGFETYYEDGWTKFRLI